ncbi:hypothetical protein JB92DRAFT_2992147 [Gautieria morchelliformis]|nr:hypothetical protein JB92DRAFT_2992147 [Gautieria morchelliformis]
MAYTTSTLDTPSLHRRKSHVFVEIPPSPLFKARVASTPSKVDDISALHISKCHKENAPPLSTKTPMNNIPTDNKNKSKRKAQGDDDGAPPGAKKAKIPPSNSESNIVGCHQCRSKKPLNSVLQCSGSSKTTGNRCKASYCDTCLRNRYGKDLRAIAQREFPEGNGDTAGAEYHFICPRCEGNCNCAPCRKKKGLTPVGKFSAQSGQSVREILEKNPEASGRLPKNTVNPTPKDTTHKSATKVTKKSRDTGDGTGTKKKLKSVPEPVWVPIPEMRSKDQVEDRIHLREFVLRFNPILNIGIRNLEELDDFTSLHDPSTKAILLSLLDLLAIEDNTQKKGIQEKAKMIRGLGLNWAKIVPVLYSLRDSMPQGHSLSTLPDLNPPSTSSEPSRNTRGARLQGVSADQLLPVLLYLIRVVGESASVRDELEEGYKQAKEFRGAYYKALREETERWAAERAQLTEEKREGEKNAITKENADAWKVKFRNAEAQHKSIIAYIQNSHRAEMDCSASRFTSLGCDAEGRTYYALSASGPQRGKKERLPSESERFAMRRWGWFIAVYGKPGTVIQPGSEDDIEEDEDEGESKTARWWGFVDVEEMRKLSKWVAYCAEANTPNSIVSGTKSTDATATSGTFPSCVPSLSGSTVISRSESRPLSPVPDPLDPPTEGTGIDRDNSAPLATSAGMKALAKAILDFADFIDWRLNRDQASAKGKGTGAIAPTKFYT